MLPQGGDRVVVQSDVAYRERFGYLPHGFCRHGGGAEVPLASLLEQGTDIGGIEPCIAPGIRPPPDTEAVGSAHSLSGKFGQMALIDREHSAGAGIDEFHKLSQGPELQAVLWCQREVERLVGLLEERDRIHRGHSGLTQVGIEIGVATKVQMLIDKLLDAIFR